MMLEGEIALRTVIAAFLGFLALTLIALNVLRPRSFRKSEKLKQLRNPLLILVVTLVVAISVYLLINPILEHYTAIKKEEAINNKF